MKKRWR